METTLYPSLSTGKDHKRFGKASIVQMGCSRLGIDTMVFVHEFTFHRNENVPTGNMRVVFGLPQLVHDMRALRLKCFVGEGRSIGSYLGMLPSLDGSGEYLWGLDAQTLRRARRECVLMCTRPADYSARTATHAYCPRQRFYWPRERARSTGVVKV